MALRPLKRVEQQDLKRATIANAVGTGTYVLSVGDAIQPGATGHNKFVTGAASSGLILGVITSIIQNGKVSEKTSITGVNSALSGAPSTGPGTDNETYAVWQVDYIPSYIPVEYEIDVDTALTATDQWGFGFFNLLGVSTTAGDAGKLAYASFALFSGTAGQIVSMGVTASSTTKVHGHIYKTF